MPCLWLNCELNWMGLFPSERVVSGMSLGRKNSMYRSFKGAPRKQFRGFHAIA